MFAYMFAYWVSQQQRHQSNLSMGDHDIFAIFESYEYPLAAYGTIGMDRCAEAATPHTMRFPPPRLRSRTPSAAGHLWRGAADGPWIPEESLPKGREERRRTGLELGWYHLWSSMLLQLGKDTKRCRSLRGGTQPNYRKMRRMGLRNCNTARPISL